MGEYDAPRGRHAERARQVSLIISGINQMVYVEPDTYRPSPHDIEDTEVGFDLEGNYHRLRGAVALSTEMQHEQPEI